MAKPTGGTAYVTADGIALTMAGDDMTVSFQKFVKNEQVRGYYTETDKTPFIEGTFVFPGDFPDEILDRKDLTVTVALKNGRNGVLRGAYVEGDVDFDAGKGEVKIKFMGSDGQWM